MFTVDDFIKLLKYYKDGTSTGLDTNLLILADNAKARSTTLFNENLDLPAHLTDDYKRLKEVLIRWYAGQKTLIDTMKHASDIRSLPDDHLNVLLNSFGFTDEISEITHKNKIDFFYDLVNLYKVKGTPEAIMRVLGYFGFPNVDVLEYWLQYDIHGDLIFRPDQIENATGLNIISKDLDFDEITSADPHWMLTKNQVNSLFLTNKIAFPSKSPYFSIRPSMQLTGNTINTSLAIFRRMIEDQYQSFKSGIIVLKDISLLTVDLDVSLLDLYLGCAYLFNLIYKDSDSKDSSDTSFLCYNGSMSLTNTEIFDLYSSLSTRVNLTRSLLKTNRISLESDFTRLRSTSFLTSLIDTPDFNKATYYTPGIVLTTTNSAFKDEIQSKYTTGSGEDFFKELLKILSTWIREHISENSTYLSSLVLGFESIDKIKKVVNFFKPYRSRLIFIDHAYLIENPVFDSVISEDSYAETIEDTIIDFDTADGKGSFQEIIEDDINSTPPTILCKRIDDLYIDPFGLLKSIYYDTEDFTNVVSPIYSNPPIGSYRIESIYLELIDGGGKKLHIVYNDIAETISGNRTLIENTTPNGYYQIYNIYLNNSLDCEVVYNSDPADSDLRLGYSRSTYDNDSYFDIGASSDFPPVESTLDITESYNEIYNSHTSDSTSYVDFNYILDSTGLEIVEINTDGGWCEFDSNYLFDTPAFSDVCKIEITQL